MALSNPALVAASSTTDESDGDSFINDAPVAPVNRIASRLSRAQSAAADPEKAHSGTKATTDENARQIRGFKWFLVCISLYLSAFLYGLDTTIAADVQGAVIEAFGHVEQLAWIGAGFPLGSVAVILPIGALYTSFNMKWIFVASMAMFELGSAVCGAAPNMNAEIIGRVIAGIGGSGVYLGCLNYFLSLTSREERGRYITLIGACWGIGAVLGPVIGGAFSVSAASWRWAFYINLVIGAVTAPIFILYLPPIHPIRGVSLRTRISNLDVVGFVLIAAVWVLFTMALTMAGGQWPWNDGRTIATLVVFGVVLSAYVAQQYFAIFTTKQTRSFPGHLLKSRTQVLLFIATAANITALFVVVYFIPIYFQFVHNDSAIMAAVRLLPFVVVSVVFNLLAGHFLPKMNYYMPIYVVSGLVMTLGAALLMAYLDPSTPTANIYGFTVIVAFGTGLTLQIGYAVSSLKAPVEDTGDSISLQNVAQIGGSVIALVIAGQIFQSVALRNLDVVLAGQGFSSADIHSVLAGAQSHLFEQLSEELRAEAITAITKAMQKSFILVIVAGAVTTVAGLLMRVERLFTLEET